MENQVKSFSIMALSCVAALAMMASPAQAAGGVRAASDTATLQLGGHVIAGTCVIGGTSGIIELPPVAARSLNGSGKTAGARNFDIPLSDCPPGVSVRAHFLGDTSFVDSQTGFYKNYIDNDAAAQNVQIALTDSSGNPIHVGAPQTEEPVRVDASGKATLTYGAQYYAVGAVVPGNILTYASFNVEYL